jgi:hypothetical protein
MPDARRVSRLSLTAILTIGSGMLLASCGGGGDVPAADEPAVAESAPASSAAAAPQVDACTLITREEAAAALGQPVGEGVREDTSPVFSCKYDAESNIEQLRVTATAFPSAQEAKEAYEMIVRSNDYEPVSGIGDRAYIPAIADLSVHRGRWELDIGLVLPGNREARFDKAKALASTAIARLPE